MTRRCSSAAQLSDVMHVISPAPQAIYTPPNILVDLQESVTTPPEDEDLFNVDEEADLSVGIICQSSAYEMNIGDIEHASTLGVPTFTYTIDALTFADVKNRHLNAEVESKLEDAIKYFEERNVDVITGNCGFFAQYQHLIAEMTHLPVVMSSLTYLPLLGTFYNHTEKIGLLTANGPSLEAGLRRNLYELFAFDLPQRMIDQCVVIGMEDVPGFGTALETGEKVHYHSTQKRILKKLVEANKEHDFQCFLVECTQLPQFSDAIRYQFDVPVFDIVTLVESIVAGKMPNQRFGDFRKTVLTED